MYTILNVSLNDFILGHDPIEGNVVGLVGNSGDLLGCKGDANRGRR